jgi:hypothetical protein
MFSRPTLNIFNKQPNIVNLKSWYIKDISSWRRKNEKSYFGFEPDRKLHP